MSFAQGHHEKWILKSPDFCSCLPIHDNSTNSPHVFMAKGLACVSWDRHPRFSPHLVRPSHVGATSIANWQCQLQILCTDEDRKPLHDISGMGATRDGLYGPDISFSQKRPLSPLCQRLEHGRKQRYGTGRYLSATATTLAIGVFLAASGDSAAAFVFSSPSHGSHRSHTASRESSKSLLPQHAVAAHKVSHASSMRKAGKSHVSMTCRSSRNINFGGRRMEGATRRSNSSILRMVAGEAEEQRMMEGVEEKSRRGHDILREASVELMRVELAEVPVSYFMVSTRFYNKVAPTSFSCVDSQR